MLVHDVDTSVRTLLVDIQEMKLLVLQQWFTHAVDVPGLGTPLDLERNLGVLHENVALQELFRK